MALQIPNPGVFSQVVSNADDDGISVPLIALSWDPFNSYMTALEKSRFTAFLWDPKAFRALIFAEIREKEIMELARTLAQIIEKSPSDREHMLNLLSCSRADGYQLRLLNDLVLWPALKPLRQDYNARELVTALGGGHPGLTQNLLGPKQFQLLDHTKYDSAGWEVSHSSFGKVYNKSCMIQKARSHQQLLSRKIVCQDSGVESTWDVQDYFKSMSGKGSNHFLGQRTGTKNLAPELLGNFKECPLSSIGSNVCLKSLENEEPCVGNDLMQFSELLHYSTLSYLNKHKETMLKDPMLHLDDDTFNQNKRKETANCVSSILIFATLCLCFLLMTSNQFQKHSAATMFNVQQLHKEQALALSIVVPLLGLFSFMVFVCVVATMILAGAKFTRMHTAIVLFLAILMNVRSYNSIDALYLPIGIFFIGRYARPESNN